MKETVMFVLQKLSGGGAERVASVLASELAAQGLEVSVLAYFPTAGEYPVSDGAKKIYLTKSQAEYDRLTMAAKLVKIRRLIGDNQVRYAVPFLFFVGMHVQAACLGMKVRVVQTVRNDPRSEPGSRLLRGLRNLTCLLMWRGFVQNERQLAYFPRIIRKKMAVLPNPVDGRFEEVSRERRAAGGRKVILAVGRLERQKNFELLIEAAARLAEKRSDFAVRIWGEGELFEPLNALICERGIAGICKLCGRSPDMVPVYSEADIFVLTSHYEGMPNALMEAMASGLTCIAADCPTGPRELITDGVNGYLIPVNDTDALVRGLERCLDGAEELGRAARETIIPRYSQSAVAKEFITKVLLLNREIHTGG